MKIRPVGAELFHTDRRTDRHDEANSCFLQFLRTRLKTNYVTSVCPSSIQATLNVIIRHFS
jgi:hypothetical protein